MVNSFLSDLRQFLPSDRIYTDELRTLGWGTDASFYRQIPKVVIRSDGEEEISKIVRLCQKYKLPFTFRAAGTSLSGQSCTDSVLIVAGKHWEKYEIGENQETVRLQPGIVGAKVNEFLKPYGRVFPPDPASIGSAMVGGIVINNASGMNCGVHANSDRMMVSARLILADGTIVDALARHEVHPGDVFYIPAGRIHAICGGVYLAEVQQSSDVTYRIYDYGRLGLDGQPRELHTELAKDAIDYNVVENYKKYHDKGFEIVGLSFDREKDPWFHRKLFKYDSFIIYMCLEGNCTIKVLSTRGFDGDMPLIREVHLSKGNSCLVPAAVADIMITPMNEEGRTKLLEVYIDNKHFNKD